MAATAENPFADRQAINAYPSDLTFEQLIRKNKMHSMWLVVGMMGLAVVLIGFIVTMVMFFGMETISIPGIILSLVVAVVVVIISSIWSYYGGGKAILRMSNARPIEKQDDPQLYNVVEEVSIAAGMPMPKLYLIESPSMNAFATGRDPDHAAVAITRGLRDKLTRDELQAVMAHEVAHIRHYDIRLTMLVATLAGLIVLACDVFLRATFYGSMTGGGRRYSGGGDRKGGGAAMIILLLIALLLSIVAPLMAKIIQLAVSRQREYLADAGAVQLTRYPQGLASALSKLSTDNQPLRESSRATAHMWIVNPIMHAKGQDDRNTMFATHPPLHDRIQRILALNR